MGNVMYSTIKPILLVPDCRYYVIIPTRRLNDYCTRLTIDDLVDKIYAEVIDTKNSNVKVTYYEHTISIEGKLKDLKNWDDGAWWDRIENDLQVTSIRQEDDILYINLTI